MDNKAYSQQQNEYPPAYPPPAPPQGQGQQVTQVTHVTTTVGGRAVPAGYGQLPNANFHRIVGIIHIIFGLLVGLVEVVGIGLRVVTGIAYVWGTGIWLGILNVSIGVLAVGFGAKGSRDLNIWMLLLIGLLLNIAACVTGGIAGILEVLVAVALLQNSLQLISYNYTVALIYAFLKCIVDLLGCLAVGILTIVHLVKAANSRSYIQRELQGVPTGGQQVQYTNTTQPQQYP